MMCLSVMGECPAVRLQQEFVAKDAGCDTTDMPRLLINWYFGTCILGQQQLHMSQFWFLCWTSICSSVYAVHTCLAVPLPLR